MASAFKCDRCGCLYPGADKSIKFRTGSNTYISTLWIGNTDSWDSGPKDICPDCARDFLCWWEHSNISAQYELRRIRDDLRANAEFAASNVVKTYVNDIPCEVIQNPKNNSVYKIKATHVEENDI